jgi:hypothetical protein
VARLTPLGHPTINLQGRYRTTSRPPLTGLRPLRTSDWLRICTNPPAIPARAPARHAYAAREDRGHPPPAADSRHRLARRGQAWPGTCAGWRPSASPTTSWPACSAATRPASTCGPRPPRFATALAWRADAAPSGAVRR